MLNVIHYKYYHNVKYVNNIQVILIFNNLDNNVNQTFMNERVIKFKSRELTFVNDL